MLSITMDWLAFTFKEDSYDSGTWIRRFTSDKGSIPITPTNGYRSAYRSAHKVDVMWNVDRAEMGYHVIIAGTAIRNICEHMELEQKALLETVLHAGGSITRLDLAKDLRGREISLDKVYKDLEKGRSTGSARTFSQIHSVNGGNTVYVGSRQSEKFVRIYDKAAQIGDTNERWFRFELELKGVVARSLCNYLRTTERWDSAFDTIALHMVDLPNNVHWKEFFSSDFIPVGLPKVEKSSDREKWIDTQVTPAVVKHYMENRDSKAIQNLREMLDYLDRKEGSG